MLYMIFALTVAAFTGGFICGRWNEERKFWNAIADVEHKKRSMSHVQ